MDWWFKHLFSQQIYELSDTSENAKILKGVYNLKLSSCQKCGIALETSYSELDSGEDTGEYQRYQWISYMPLQLILKQ